MSPPQAQKATKQGVSPFRRFLELILLLVSSMAAFFFFKEAEKSQGENDKLQQELRRLKRRNSDDGTQSGICSVCLTDPLEVLFDPCGHIATCSHCSEQCVKCPLCRRDIESTKKVYLAS